MARPIDLREQLQHTLGASYLLGNELGGGGMARVFVAEERSLGRRVVVKVLPPETAGYVSAERFRREVQVAAGLQHPHIVPLLNAGESDGLLYYTMPYVTGETLRATLSRDGALSIPVAVRVIRDVVQALAHAHRHGVVHRDIKPENILLGEDGDALVSDFGIAKALAAATRGGPEGGHGALTSTGLSLGTPAYMAPEQALGDMTTDYRADLYALGVVAYEALAGSAPFVGRSAQALLAAHATETPEPLTRRRSSVPPALATLVMRLMEKQPGDRPQTADEVLAALDGVSTTPGGHTGHVQPVIGVPSGRRRWALGTGLGLLLLTGFVAYAFDRARRTTSAKQPSSDAAELLAAPRASVAVLPFVNTSGDVGDEHFSDGLTDELIAALGKVGALQVAGRTSSFALKGKVLNVRTIGDTLHVATVLEGSVRRAGDRLKITAQLVDTRDGKVRWAESYDRELKDVFAVQEEIARAIVGALRVTLSGSAAALIQPGTADLVAYDLYLRGRMFFNQRTNRGLLEALRYFEQAIARDPMYARAYSGLADTQVLLVVFGDRTPRDALPRARAATAKALALDSTAAEAHASLAHLLFAFDWNWTAARREFERSSALDSHYAPARQWLGIYLMDQGRFDEAEATLREALAFDPLSAAVNMTLGRLYVSARRETLAISQLKKALELGPMLPITHVQLGYAYLQKGMSADAVAAFRRAASLGHVADSAQLAYGLAVTNHRAEATAVVRALLGSSHKQYLPPVPMATAYAGLGDADAAFRWLEQGYVERAAFMDGVKISPAFAPLHTDPRWAALLHRLHLDP